MPTFDTPNPIDLAINLQVGRIDVIASVRADTIVTLAPSSSRPNDRKAVDETRVTFENERLSIVGPKPKINWIGPNAGDSVDITIELPSESRFTAEIAVGDVRATGRLGATRIKSATGSVELDETGDLWVRTAHGTTKVSTADGDADITAAYGQIRVGKVSGDAVMKSSHGGIELAEAVGDVEAKLSYGDLNITQAHGSITAKTGFGTTTLGEVSSGSIQVDSGYGAVIVGVRPGVPAWLDLSSKLGRVRNELSAESAPQPSEGTVAVRVRTAGGDITVGPANQEIQHVNSTTR